MVSRRDAERKAAALTGLAANYGKEIPPVLLPMWMKGLDPFTPEEVAEAVVRVIQSYEYKTLPPFAVLLKFLPKRGNALPDPEEAKRVKAESEWARLLDAIRTFGYSSQPPMHPLTEFVLKSMGGWGCACREWLESELHWRRKEFVEAWVRMDGMDLAMLEGGARAIERAAAQRALGEGDDRTLRRIERRSAERLRLEAGGEGGE